MNEKTARRTAALLFAFAAGAGSLSAQAAPVRIEVRADSKVGPMDPIWAWFGYDEPNYTYMPNGVKLLGELADLSPVPVHVRTHNLLNTGDGSAALKWGSTNAYTEDADGNPKYDWTIVDSILGTYVNKGIKPLVEIGFMPEALSSHPTPYRHHWKPGDPYGDIYTGWAYPPTDYDKWSELVYQWVHHEVEKFGKDEVEGWWWEVWNEPDIGYWQGTSEEYQKLYDYAAEGLKRALPTARIGGPEVTGPLGPRTRRYMSDFLRHVASGTNYATGKTGSPIDFVSFHAKGSPRVMPDGHVRMSVANQLRAIFNGFRIVASVPKLAHLPIVIGESDPEGCAACPVSKYPANDYRNGTMYSSYTAEQIARTYQLADEQGVNLAGSVTWAFEFEGQRYFDGFRSLASNGIDKPVLNTFRMLGLMRGDRVATKSSGGLSLEHVRDKSVRGRDDVSALASRDEHSVSVLVWNYNDDDLPGDPSHVQLTITGLPDGEATMTHYRIDQTHSNAYALWKKMGSPQSPTQTQYQRLEEAGGLQMLDQPSRVEIAAGKTALSFDLPRQGVSLVKLTW